MKVKLIFFLLFNILIKTPVFSNIIHVSLSGSDSNTGTLNEPLATIQKGINVSTNGDTVLVQSGTYYENIDLNGKNIVLSSLFLTTKDTSYISNTIINGNKLGSVITINKGEAPVIIGFLITNGLSTNGGGIYCSSSDPILENLMIRNNSSNEWGGGITIYNSNAELKKLIIDSNTTVKGGGGLYMYGNGTPTLNTLLISNNKVTNSGYPSQGGGIRSGLHEPILIASSTIVNNSAVDGGGLWYPDYKVTVSSCIFWSNSGYQIIYGDATGICGDLEITNSIIENGVSGIYEGNGCPNNVIWDLSNTTKNPLFIDENSGNYRLSNNSPAIGIGNSQNILDTDLDNNSRPKTSSPDIGAYENELNFPAIYFDSDKCDGDTVNIYYNGDTSNYKLNWTFLNYNWVDTSQCNNVKIIFEGEGYNKIELNITKEDDVLNTQIDSTLIFSIPSAEFTIDTNKLCGLDIILVSYIGTGTSNANFNWNFSSGNIISGAGQGDYQINWSSAGLKNISLSVEENGCTSTSTSQNVKVYQPSSSFSMDNVVCENQNTSISFNGIASDSASFDWDFDGANIVSESNETYFVNWDNLGVKNVSLIINDNGCVSSQTIESIERNPIPTPTFTAPEKVCYNGIANIEYLGTATSSANYNWNFNNGSILSGTAEGPYEITWGNSGVKTISLNVTENGCNSDTSISVSVNQQTQPISICMVSIDSSNHNMIVWEQAIDNAFDSIIVYKETSQTDVYEKIGSHSSGNKSVFIDKNSNPAQNSSRYKIAVLDTCGYETSQSEYHKTMHLTINSGINGAWNLIWDGYEGFSYSTYNIYRGTSDDNMLKIAEQASNTFTYTDLTPPVETVYYQIEVENPNSCNISNLKSSNNYYGSTRSNIVNSSLVNSINELSFDGVEIYPNPASDKLYIKSIATTNYDMEILSLDGKLMIKYQNVQNGREYDISTLKSGLYILKLANDTKSMNMILIKR